MSTVRIVADSIAKHGKRIVTMEVDLWRPLLAEFNTHRQLSRGSASSRAIPIERMVQKVSNDPFIPKHWGTNQKGMRAGEPVSLAHQLWCAQAWLDHRNDAVKAALRFHTAGIHKSIPNRLLEPWMTTTIVCTATELENFVALRTEKAPDGTPMAESHFDDVAEDMVKVLNASEPVSLQDYQWHLPYVREYERDGLDWEHSERVMSLVKRSVARCGRVSYLKQDGLPATLEEDYQRHDGFIKDGHMGPLEHQASPAFSPDERSGNFRGWLQYRQGVPGQVRSAPRLLKKEWRG